MPAVTNAIAPTTKDVRRDKLPPGG
ncbi:uncharacterized protein METZ01_LOCUS123430 [marine metagenome]|uniref:Uncharacterized protein n=1 Tax=marine metagenome TaxID=408172 RepID=A0A381Y0G0_9ZZZZ